jgi:CRISPR/Cas system CMR subunit Cmr4 (Cas7 group RAMP superfamily)
MLKGGDVVRCKDALEVDALRVVLVLKSGNALRAGVWSESARADREYRMPWLLDRVALDETMARIFARCNGGRGAFSCGGFLAAIERAGRNRRQRERKVLEDGGSWTG